jgi:hypothetical protein
MRPNLRLRLSRQKEHSSILIKSSASAYDEGRSEKPKSKKKGGHKINPYTDADLGTTPYKNWKDDSPIVGPRFDLKLKNKPKAYFGEEEEGSTKKGDDAEEQKKEIDMSPAMFDKLISIFRKKKEEEWVGLLASSEKWYELSDGLFKRIEERVNMVENDPKVNNKDEEELLLARLLRKLKETHFRCIKHRDLLRDLLEKEDEFLEGFVPQRRSDFDNEFFSYLTFKIERSTEVDKTGAETANLARIASRVLAIIETFDEASRDQDMLDTAAQNFQELLKVETVQDMDARIDELAQQGKLDPALMLTAAKAYMSVKESPFVEEEVKDVMVHLYTKMRDTVGRQQPKEVRILKLILSIDDPIEQRNMLEQAFTPGPELEDVGGDDMLWCSPENLLQTVDVILKTRERAVVKQSLGGDAARMMTPEIIERMKGLKSLIEDQFM